MIKRFYGGTDKDDFVEELIMWFQRLWRRFFVSSTSFIARDISNDADKFIAIWLLFWCLDSINALAISVSADSMFCSLSVSVSLGRWRARIAFFACNSNLLACWRDADANEAMAAVLMMDSFNSASSSTNSVNVFIRCSLECDAQEQWLWCCCYEASSLTLIQLSACLAFWYQQHKRCLRWIVRRWTYWVCSVK